MNSVLEIRPSAAVLAGHILLIEIAAGLSYLSLILINIYSPGLIVDIQNRAKFEVTVFIFSLLIRVSLISLAIISWLRFKYKITQEDLTITKGVVFAYTNQYSLAQVENIKCTKTPMGNIFGYGSITLKLRLSNNEILLPNISNPDLVIDKLSEMVKNRANIPTHNNSIAIHRPQFPYTESPQLDLNSLRP